MPARPGRSPTSPPRGRDGARAVRHRPSEPVARAHGRPTPVRARDRSSKNANTPPAPAASVPDRPEPCFARHSVRSRRRFRRERAGHGLRQCLAAHHVDNQRAPAKDANRHAISPTSRAATRNSPDATSDLHRAERTSERSIPPCRAVNGFRQTRLPRIARLVAQAPTCPCRQGCGAGDGSRCQPIRESRSWLCGYPDPMPSSGAGQWSPVVRAANCRHAGRRLGCAVTELCVGVSIRRWRARSWSDVVGC